MTVLKIKTKLFFCSKVKLNYFQYLETNRNILSPSMQLPTVSMNMACGLTRSNTVRFASSVIHKNLKC